jgi:hypothetical protein
MVNYSEGGLYFESQTPLKSGSSIHIKVEESSSTTAGSPPHYGFRTLTLGEVKLPAASRGASLVFLPLDGGGPRWG